MLGYGQYWLVRNGIQNMDLYSIDRRLYQLIYKWTLQQAWEREREQLQELKDFMIEIKK